MDIYKSSTNVYPVSYQEQYRLGNLKNFLASEGTMCDDFNKCKTVAEGLAKANELWEKDYEIACKYFK